MKKLFALLTCVMLLLTLLPLGAVSAADAAAPVVVGGVPMQEGDYLAVGADTPQATKPTGGYAHYKDGTLTLNNYTYKGSGYEFHKDNYALIYCGQSLVIRLMGINALNEYKAYGYMSGIFSYNRVTITADSDAELSIFAQKHGIYTGYHYEFPLTITGGTIRITGADYGIYTINKTLDIKDCTLDIQADTCGIYLSDGYIVDEGYIAPIKENGVIIGYKGGLIIDNSHIKINSIVDGIQAHHITVDNSALDISEQTEHGIDAMNMVINSGTVTANGVIYASYDLTVNGGTVTATSKESSGILGAKTNNSMITINGGTVTAIGEKIGIYATAGDVIINGGTVISQGKTQSGIYAYKGNIYINGGRVNATSLAKNDLYWALKSYSGSVTVNENLYQVGSYTPDGELIPYDAAQSKEFDRVIICGEHVYDGACDGECNHCGTARTAKAHTWKNGKCAVCGKASPTKVKLTAVPATARYAKAGATVSAKVTAKGDGLKYQWYVKNAGGTKYSKSAITKASYAVAMSSKVKGRRVYCVVTDQYGNKVQSKTFILRESVSITTQPKTVSVKKNATAKVTVKAKGDGLRYQWYVKNEGRTKYSKSSVKTATYRTTMTAKAKNRLLLCIITDQYGNKVQTKTVKLKMK